MYCIVHIQLEDDWTTNECTADAFAVFFLLVFGPIDMKKMENIHSNMQSIHEDNREMFYEVRIY